MKKNKTNNIFKYGLLATLVSATLGITACNDEASSSVQPEAQSKPVFTTGKENDVKTLIGLKGSQGVRFNNGWLLASEKSGLVSWNGESDNGNTLAKGEYKYLQASSDIAITFDTRTDRVQPFSVVNGTLTKLALMPELDYEINWVCLQPRQQDGLTYVWLGGESGNAQQWVLGHKGNWNPKFVRSISVPMGTLNCSLDSTTDTLYIAEQQAGIWAIDAHPQAVKETELVVAKPHNTLTSVFADDGHVFYQDETGRVFSDGNQVAFNKGDEVEGLTVFTGNQKQSVLSFDDENDQYLLSNWTIKLQPKDKAEKIREIPAWVESANSDRAGDTMDDPAIWVNKTSPADSLILGAHKRWGLLVFDMQGNQVQSIGTGRINNIDLRQNLLINGETKSIAIASLRDGDKLAVYEITQKGHVIQTAVLDTHLNDIYGMCLYKDDSQLYAFANEKSGKTIQYRVNLDTQTSITKVRELSAPSQVEGCVANDQTGELFVGEEDQGVWKYDANAQASSKGEMIIKVGGPLVDDVEGLDLYHGQDKSYLVVSSQGNDSYILYNSEAPYQFVTQFRIGTNFDKGIDGSSETDGLAVTSMPVGDGPWSQGMLVVQDGRNRMPDANQDFKWIPWSSIFNNN
ncbi:phytase [Shewanella sp. OPT22]|nr:phytase [Shewanella sp. OPT22]